MQHYPGEREEVHENGDAVGAHCVCADEAYGYGNRSSTRTPTRCFLNITYQLLWKLGRRATFGMQQKM
jgi:hypothetical protein